MTPNPGAVALLALSFAAFALVMHRFRRLAAVFASIMMVLFPIFSDTSDWNNWFDWAKRYSLLVAMFMWCIMHALPELKLSRWFARAMPYVLIINVLEAALLEFPHASPLNGFLILCVAACVPLQLRWDSGYRRFGFRGLFWQLAYLTTLARLFVLNQEFENSFVGAMLVLIIPSLFSLAERDSFNYLGWRIYTIYGLLLQDSLLPKISEHLYPVWLHAENRVRWHGAPFANVWLGLNVVIVGFMIYERVRGLRGVQSPQATAQTSAVA